ncbi:MAG: DNA repair protein RecO [Parachlamydiaceae bacterium]|nr:DNA repair protein RecO [Parachlamydiaceae bacterium]
MTSSKLLFRSDGVVLNALPFQDFDLILTVFSLEEGIIKLIVKGAGRSKQKRENITPLTCAEFVYSKGRSELFRSHEISIISHHLKLRQSLGHLEAACDLLHAIQNSQMEQTPAPMVYKLLMWSLDKIPLVPDPNQIAASFRLKLLRHDGLLLLSLHCSECGERGHAIVKGETFCLKHAVGGVIFSDQEFHLLGQLAFLSSLSELDTLVVTQELRKRIERLCQDCWA